MPITIEIPEREATEKWDPIREEFINLPYAKPATLILEHSLLSVSKWESKYHKPFLSKTDAETRTPEEMMYYIQCMTINNVDPDVYYRLTDSQIQEIGDYIADPMTATTINRRGPQGSAPRPRSNEIVTSEIIYYWMVVHQIPFECQKWHLNRLLMLVEVCNIKNGPQQKMSKNDILRQNHALNAARRAKFHSRG